MADLGLALSRSNKTPAVRRPRRLLRIARLRLVRVAQLGAAFTVVPCCILSTNKTPSLSQNTVAITLRVKIDCVILTLTGDDV